MSLLIHGNAMPNGCIIHFQNGEEMSICRGPFILNLMSLFKVEVPPGEEIVGILVFPFPGSLVVDV